MERRAAFCGCRGPGIEMRGFLLPGGAPGMDCRMHEKILVVDDNRDNVEILRAFLESRGYVVSEAPDGRTALARVEEVKPDLVLLDVMMPGMDGWQVCRTIKSHPELGGTRVVMVTAKGGFEDKFEGLRSGADDYVVKPVDFKELEAKVKRNLNPSERPA
jgi:DNA-binding response OmpR family regulator